MATTTRRPGWYDLVDYDTAVRLLSTAGDNCRPYFERLTAAECEARAFGAWYANDRESYVAHRSAAAHKRDREATLDA